MEKGLNLFSEGVLEIAIALGSGPGEQNMRWYEAQFHLIWQATQRSLMKSDRHRAVRHLMGYSAKPRHG